MQQIDRLLGTEDRWDRVRTIVRTHKTTTMKLFRLWPKLGTRKPRLYSRTALDRPKTATTTEFSPIAKVVRQQTPETSANHHKLNAIHIDVAIETTQSFQELTNTKLYDAASQTSPPHRIQHQSSVIATEQLRESQTQNGLVPFLNCSNSCPNDIQESTKHIMTTHSKDNNIPLFTI